MADIQEFIKDKETKEVANKIEEIENTPKDSQKMFQVIKQLSKQKRVSKLLIESENGFTADEQKQADLIAEYFKKQFYRNAEKIQNEPTVMQIPFTTEEIKKAIMSLKNNKSTGIDNVKAELLKIGPEIFCEEIAQIFNETASTGIFPKELILGIITALQKPRKKKGPIENLRPITLLSVLRKILATCMMKRIGEKINKEIPISQAAYCKGRSTTEHVFACKIVAEKAATSTNFEIHYLLLDMSKAFDSIIRSELVKDLQKILNKDELNMIKILLGTELIVQVGKSRSSIFKTDTGAPQGDCCSGQEFTYYLAKSLEEKPDEEHIMQTREEQSHCNEVQKRKDCEKPSQEKEIDNVEINMEYADDITIATTDKKVIERIKEKIPPSLQKRGLMINMSKTEEYTVKYKNEDEWKNAKILGSKLNTEADIANRKSLSLNALTNLKEIFQNKRLSTRTKVRAFEAYITPIFLYNSELWTLTKTLENQIDSFHRRILRSHVLNIRWPKIVKNEDVYEKTKIEPWSKTIEKKRIKWFGHLMRLDENTPAQKALRVALMQSKRPRGRPKLTWIEMMRKQLQTINLTWEEASHLAKDREK